jgi:ABC-2 type transport system permease protein
MRSSLTICKKELQVYFFSPTAYVAFAFYFLLLSFFFSMDFLFGSNMVDARNVTGSMMIVLLFVTPIVTMRMLAEEFRQGTDELLLTSPVSSASIIIGKYAAGVAVMFVMIAGSLVYPWIMSWYGSLDHPVLWTSYLGMFFLGASMIAVGLFASSLSSHQMLSGIIAFALLLMLWMIDWLGEGLYGKAREWVVKFSLTGRAANFNKGVFHVEDAFFYVALSFLFLLLAIQVLERKRWR